MNFWNKLKKKGSKEKNVICPYCLTELNAFNKMSQLRFYCPTCDEPVLLSSREWWLFRLKGKYPKCKNPSCFHSIASVCKCGSCSNELEPYILNFTGYLRFALIGPIGSGKSNFLTAMTREIRNGNGMMAVEYLDQSTKLSYEAFSNQLYDQKTPVPPTPPRQTPTPQRWKLYPDKNSPNPIYSLTVYDGAGEDCQLFDVVVSRYITGAKELVLLFDPLIFPAVQKVVPENLRNWSKTSELGQDTNNNLISDLADFIRKNSNLDPNLPIAKRTAVVFTKLDLIRGMFNQRGCLLENTPQTSLNGFDDADSLQVHRELTEWLRSINEGNFISSIDRHFSDVRYFAISSFGRPPVDIDTLEAVEPYRVIDPLMWMLAEEGVIPKLN